MGVIGRLPHGVQAPHSLSVAAAGIWSLPADVAPSSRHVGSIGGLQNFASNLAGIFTPVLIGVLVDQTGSYEAPLAVIGSVSLAGAANYLSSWARWSR